MARHMLVLLVWLALAGCGGRSLPVSDGAVGPAPDTADAACAVPPGYCEYNALKDPCPTGEGCAGCYACKGKAYWRCGCSEIVPCPFCSLCIGKCMPKT